MKKLFTKSKLFLIIISAFLQQTAFTQNTNLSWAKSISGPYAGAGHSVAVDAFGNVYTTGDFNGTVDFDPGPGIFNVTAVGAADIFISKLNSAGNFVWAKTMGGMGSESGLAITLDTLGNAYVTGNFDAIVDFDPNAGVFNLTSSGFNDIFISKLDSAGNFIWAKQFGGSSIEFSTGIALDKFSNIYTTGYFQSTTDFDPGVSVFNLNSASQDIFVSKLDPSGNFLWAKQMGGSSNDQSNAIAVDTLGNVYTTGLFQFTADFDPGAGVFNFTSLGSYDAFISKLDASGNFVWAKHIGDSINQIGYGITLDASGNVYATGYFHESPDFDPGPGLFNLTSAGNHDVYILKLDAAGNFAWAKQLGGIGYDYSTGIALDDFGNVYTTGYFGSSADFDPGAVILYLTASGDEDIFISKLDAVGNFVWVKQLGGISHDHSLGITVDAARNVYTTGYFQSTADFDPGVGTYNLIASGFSPSVFIHKLCQTASTPNAISGATSVCAGSINTYTTTSQFANSYVWNLPNGWIGSSTVNTITAAAGITGVFSVSATNGCGISGKQTLSVTVKPKPTINTVSSSNTICIGQTASLTASGASTYTWDTGATTSSIAVSPTATTNYTVNGTGTNGCGNVASINLFVATCIGIESFILDPSSLISIYPNPCKEILNVKFELAKENSIFTITNTLGQLVLKDKITTGQSSFNINSLPEGIYFVKIDDIVKKIIKSN